MIERQPMDPTDAFAELGRIKLSETDIKGVLTLIAELAQRTIPGTDEVSVTLVPAEGAYTAASTSARALALDEGQYEEGHGPCLDASVSGASLSLPDMAAESRWPDWTPRALSAGVHSSLSIGLPIHETASGALNVYADKPQNFDEDAIILAQTFAGYAAVALANAHLYDVSATLARHMQAAMESRAVIEQAKGIIMGDRRCTAEEAFRILSRLSQDSNRKLRDVAALLVERAQQPSGS